MARIALLRADVVENIIEAELGFAETLGYDAAVESDSAGIAWTYTDGQFVAPPSPEPETPIPEPAVLRWITRLALRNRFTLAENVAIEIACLDDATATMAQRQQAAALRVMQRQVAEATYIDLDSADLRVGVAQLEAGGLIATGRALEILDTPILPNEEYKV